MTAFLLAHGAGAGQAHPWMQRWAGYLRERGTVHAFDYPYIQEGRRLPPRLPTLEPVHRAQLEAFCQEVGERVVLVGKSMGSRLSCRVAAPALAKGVICLGYPLIGRGKAPKLRLEELRGLELPCLLVQGERDPMSPPGLLAEVEVELRDRLTVHRVPDGDHSLIARKRTLKRLELSQEDLDQAALCAVDAFVAELEA